MFNFPTSPKSSKKPSKNSVIALYNGQVFDKFTVKAAQGFNISSIHKYEFYNENGSVRVRYCRVCSRVREIFHIDGKDVDYVQNSFKRFKGGSVKAYNFEKSRAKFESILREEYGKVAINT